MIGVDIWNVEFGVDFIELIDTDDIFLLKDRVVIKDSFISLVSESRKAFDLAISPLLLRDIFGVDAQKLSSQIECCSRWLIVILFDFSLIVPKLESGFWLDLRRIDFRILLGISEELSDEICFVRFGDDSFAFFGKETEDRRSVSEFDRFIDRFNVGAPKNI